MPPELRAAYQQLLASGQDPAAMEQVASQLETYGYHAEAAQLRAKAAELRARPFGAPPLAGPPPIPYTPPPSPYQVQILPAVFEPPVFPSGAVRITATITGTGVNVRKVPTTAGNTPIGTVSSPTVVVVLNENAAPPDSSAPMGWAQIATPAGVTGYVSKQFLSMSVAPLTPQILPTVSPTLAAVQTATVTGTPGVNVRTSPSAGAALVVPNDAFKGTKVRVLNWNAAPPDSVAPQGWANVVTPGGATGYATKSAMALDAPAPVAAGVLPTAHVGSNGRPRSARCVAPSGCKIRREPSPTSRHDGIVPSGAIVSVSDVLRLPKSDARSPGRGGWARVTYGANRGWVPSEWLV
jgi:hypothetical protein